MWSRSVGLLQRRLPTPTSTRVATTTAVRLQAASETLPSSFTGNRNYVSRAHPKPIPEFPVPTAMQMVLEGIEQRKLARAERWEKSKERRVKKGIQVSPIVAGLSALPVCYSSSSLILPSSGLWSLQKSGRNSRAGHQFECRSSTTWSSVAWVSHAPPWYWQHCILSYLHC